MPKKKRASDAPPTMRTGSVSNRSASGIAQIAGWDLHKEQIQTGLSTAEIQAIFSALYREIDARSETAPAAREHIKADVQEIQSKVTEAVQKSGSIDESFVARRFRNIARMAPDMLDVIVAALANPLARLDIPAHKIAAKAKEETM